MDRINWQPLKPAGGVAAGTIASREKQAPEFAALLREKIGALKFSRHASERLESRKINLSPEQIARLEQGIKKAAGKGAQESLVLLDDLALVVSIKNRTVITAANRQDLRENVFTNIDSAVIL